MLLDCNIFKIECCISTASDVEFSPSNYTARPICDFNGILLRFTRAKEGLENLGISGITFFLVKPIYWS